MPLEPDLIDWPYERPKPTGDTQIAQGLKTTFNFRFQPPFALESDLRQGVDGAGGFMIGGSILTSGDGITWSEASTASGLNGGAISESIYVALGTNYRRSVDGGGTFSAIATPPGFTVQKVAFGNSTFVAVGPSRVSYSSDGDSWTTVFPVGEDQLWDVCYGNGLFVVVGDSVTSYTSADGISWTAHTTPGGGNNRSQSIVWTGSYFFSGGRLTDTGGSYNITSPDGYSWSLESSNIDGFGVVSFGASIFVGALNGGTEIYSSANGTTWTMRQDTGHLVNDIAFANGLFVSCGNSGNIWTSSDGETWTQRTSPVSSTLQFVTG